MVGFMLIGTSGCSGTRGWLKDRVSGASDEREILGATSIDTYIAELGSIASGDPAAQAEIVADAVSAARLTPSPSTNLRLGLVYSIPGHPASDPDAAQRILREVLSQEPLLTSHEIALATIQLNSVERQIMANSEANRLRAQSSRQAETEAQAISQRLASALTENRRLRQEIDEAREKLEAITSIERSIREQE